MRYTPILLQVALLVSWYAVPVMAATPAWVIFFPLILPIAAFCLIGGIAVIAAFLSVWASK